MMTATAEAPVNHKPSHDTIKWNTLSLVDKTGKRRYFRLWGHIRNHVVECDAEGRKMPGSKSIGYLKPAKGIAINRENKWLVDIELRRRDGFVSMLGVGETRMEAVLDYVEWYVNSFEVMKAAE